MHRDGELAEILFIAEAMRQGYKVSKPMTVEFYDFLLDANGKIFRVQVKSRNTPGRDNFYRVNTAGRNGKLNYTPEEIDILALYFSIEEDWHFKHVSEFQKLRCIAIKKGSYCKDNWDIFKSS